MSPRVKSSLPRQYSDDSSPGAQNDSAAAPPIIGFGSNQAAGSPNTMHAQPLPGMPSAAQLEQRLEADFSEHLADRNRKQKWKLGAVGAGIGSVLGVAAIGVAPPLAVAALMGGAGGYTWAKREGRKEMKKNKKRGSEEAVVVDNPTLRRLKYVVKWGQWQLLEFEDRAPESRCLVVDEVVNAFSQWVQKMFLLRASGSTCSESDPAAWDVLRHLAPLYYFLQWRASMEAVVQSAELVANAFENDCADAICAGRCQVVFPTILETISALDRLSNGALAQLQRATSVVKQDEAQEISRAHRRQRLQKIVDSLRGTLERADVQRAMAERRFSAEAKAPEETETSEDGLGSDSPRTQCDELVVPPEGIEDESGDADFCEDGGDDAYFSAGSDDEAASPGEVASPRRPPATPASDAKIARISQRHSETFPRGPASQHHSWDGFSATTTFDLRSETYLTDRRKVRCGPPLFELVSIDWTWIGASGPTWVASEHPDYYPRHMKEVLHDRRMLFVQNWVLPPYQCVMTAAVDQDAPWYRDPDSPQRRLWDRFLEMGQDRKDLFKIICVVEEGPWLVRRVIPKGLPVLIGRKLETISHHKPGEYVELVLNISSNPSDATKTAFALKALKTLSLVVGMLLEARNEDELPEQLAVLTSFHHPDPAKCGFADVAATTPDFGRR